MADPFALPPGNVLIAFSGGRTSAMMLHEILRANGGLPSRVVVSFQNTGREMPQTLDFVQECGERWGVPIVWLEWQDADKPVDRWKIVNHNSAARDGGPFEALVRKRGMLPNRVARFCTAELKVHAATRYLISLGWDRWNVARGLRADEQHRLPRAAELPEPQADLFGEGEAKVDAREFRERWHPWHPMADAGLTKRDVAEFWRRQSFDLRLPNINGDTPLGNCDGCFLKSEANLAALCRDHPERHAWWERAETFFQTTAGSAAQWSTRYRRADLRRDVERKGDGLFSTEGALCQADDGECFG